jgi:hypothetical protein
MVFDQKIEERELLFVVQVELARHPFADIRLYPAFKDRYADGYVMSYII